MTRPANSSASSARERAAHAQPRPLAGVDQLQRLDEELDLADAAFAVLEVEAGRAAHELALDPAVQLADVVDHRGEAKRGNTNGRSVGIISAPSAASPAHGRALIHAWRSHGRPNVS